MSASSPAPASPSSAPRSPWWKPTRASSPPSPRAGCRSTSRASISWSPTNVKAGRLAFTADLAAAVHGAEAVFIAVGTPTRRGDGHADLSYVYAAAEQVARALTGYTVIVTKSTVPVGTGRRIAEIVRATRPDLEFDVASNPEFLREGNAIGDFMRPDRVVIGAEIRPRARGAAPALSPALSDRGADRVHRRSKPPS